MRNEASCRRLHLLLSSKLALHGKSPTGLVNPTEIFAPTLLMVFYTPEQRQNSHKHLPSLAPDSSQHG
jgi:hypothetical protein